MADERKGVFTPEQEKQLDKLIKLKGIGEAVDGPAIKLIDNQGIDRLMKKASEETKEIIYQVVDILMEGLSTLTAEE